MFKLTIALAVLLCVTGLNAYVVTRNAPKHHLKVRDVSSSEIEPPYIPTDPIDPEDPDGEVEYLPSVEEPGDEDEDGVITYPEEEDVEVDVGPYPIDPDDYNRKKREVSDDYETYPIPPVIIPLPIIPEIPEEGTDEDIEPPYIPTDPIDPEDPDGEVEYLPSVEESEEDDEDGVITYPDSEDNNRKKREVSDDYETYPIPPVIIPLPIIPEIPEEGTEEDIEPPYIPTDPIDPEDPDGEVEYLPSVEEPGDEDEDGVITYPEEEDVEVDVGPYPIDPDDYNRKKREVSDDYETYPIPPVIIPLPIIPEIPEEGTDEDIEPPYIPTDPIDPEDPDGEVEYLPSVEEPGDEDEDGVITYPEEEDVEVDVGPYPIDPDDYNRK